MISQDDIDAFAEESEADIKAAMKFAERSKRGLPADRWAPGVKDMEAVARGIEALFAMYNMTANAFVQIWTERQQAQKDSMSLGPKRNNA